MPSISAGVVAAVVAAGSAVAGGVAQSNAANYQAKVAQTNAQIASQNQRHAAMAASSQTEQEGLKNAERAATVRNAFAANDVDVNTGSPADVQRSQRELGDLDTAQTANNAALQAYGYGAQRTSFLAQSGLDETESQDDLYGGILNGVSKGLSDYQWMSG